MKRQILLSILILSLASIADAQQSLRQSLESSNRKFIELFNKGDAAAVANLYASNARLLPPNGPMIEGRQNIQTFWQSFITMGVKLTSLEIVDVEAAGRTAIEIGRYSLTIPGAGGTSTDNGKYVVVWKRYGRSWQLSVDIWNTNAPAPSN